MPNPLHLYRSILRQCSYLPDPESRTFFLSLVRQRAEKSRRITRLQSHQLRSLRQLKIRRDGKQLLSLLTRAANGCQNTLTKVLDYTYGRAGPRRRQLLSEITVFDTKPIISPKNNEKVQQLLQSRRPFRAGDCTPFLRISSQAQALAKSLTHKGKTKVPRSPIRRLAPTIKEPNANGYEYPKRRLKGDARRFRANLFRKLVPPLPQAEVERLHALATGVIKWEGLRVRRPKAYPVYKSNVSETDAVVAAIRSQKLPKPRLRYNDKPHRLTQRFMMRVWMQTLQKVPLMNYSDHQQKWHVQWYDGRTGWFSPGERSLQAPTRESRLSLCEFDQMYFEG
ncbi:MAG: hypothetical protein M1814_002722 [Vezdaea aestivalis]|nr:MAG: hypothetical protein M1814_002722 [Vezdaea aestivalis]